MTNAMRVRSGTRSALIGVLVAMSIIATAALTTVVVQISNSDASSPPPLLPTAQPAQTPEPLPESEQPTVTETVTEGPTPASAAPSTPPPVTTITETVTPPTVPPPPPTSPTTPQSSGTDTAIRGTTATAFNAVNDYWSEVFSGWVGNYGERVYWQEPQLWRGDGFYDSTNGDPIGCSGEPEIDNAGFCSYPGAPSGTISWDMRLMREEWAFGPGPVYGTVAHEVAHAAQQRFRYDNEGGAAPPRIDKKHTELQADCISGATIAKAVQDGNLDLTAEQLARIADSTRYENPVAGDHGSAEERIAAFDLGYGGDIESCLYNKGVSPAPGVI